ncbi:MAG: hypothetical protein R3Y11_12750 [Pseudomonadota bacterium]
MQKMYNANHSIRQGQGSDGENLVWILGWEAIEKATGFKTKTLKELIKNEGLPVRHVAGRPATTVEALQAWLMRS